MVGVSAIPSSAASARENARRSDGKFGEQGRGEPGQLALRDAATSAADRFSVEESVAVRQAAMERYEQARAASADAASTLDRSHESAPGSFAVLLSRLDAAARESKATRALTLASVDESVARILDRYPDAAGANLSFETGRAQWQVYGNRPEGDMWLATRRNMPANLTGHLDRLAATIRPDTSDLAGRAVGRDGSHDGPGVTAGIVVDRDGAPLRMSVDLATMFPAAVDISETCQPDLAEFDGYPAGCLACGAEGGHRAGCPRRYRA